MDGFILWQGGFMAWIAIIELPWSSHIIPIWCSLCMILDVELLNFVFSYPPGGCSKSGYLLAPYLFEFQIGYEGRRQWTPISNGPWKIFDSLIAHGWVLSPLSGLCFHIQINLWTLPFLLGCHNVDIILGRLDYIPYSNIGWFFHAIPHYKLKSCIARATSWRTIKIEIEFRMETFTTGHIVIGFLVFTAWNICYIYFLSQRGSSETRANRTVEEQRTVLQRFGSAIFHAFQCHNWFLLPWKKGPKSKVANSHSYFPIGFGWCCSKCHLPLPKTSPAILYLWRGENAETG